MPEVIIGLSLLLLLVSMQQWSATRSGGCSPSGWATDLACPTPPSSSRRACRSRPRVRRGGRGPGRPALPGVLLVTLPLIFNSLVSAFLLTFTLSLDDVVSPAFLRAGIDHPAAGHLLARPAGPEPPPSTPWRPSPSCWWASSSPSPASPSCAKSVAALRRRPRPTARRSPPPQAHPAGRPQGLAEHRAMNSTGGRDRRLRPTGDAAARRARPAARAPRRRAIRSSCCGTATAIRPASFTPASGRARRAPGACGTTSTRRSCAPCWRAGCGSPMRRAGARIRAWRELRRAGRLCGHLGEPRARAQGLRGNLAACVPARLRRRHGARARHRRASSHANNGRPIWAASAITKEMVWQARSKSIGRSAQRQAQFDGRAFVGGQRVASADRTGFREASPHRRPAAGCGHARPAGGHRRRRGQRAARLRRWSMGAVAAGGTQEGPAAVCREHDGVRATSWPCSKPLDMGKPIRDSMAVDVPAAARCIQWYAEAVDKVYDEIAPDRPAALALDHARTDGRDRRHRPLELPHVDGRLEAGAGAGRRQ